MFALFQESLDDETIFGKIVDEWLEHWIRSRFFPVGLQLTTEGEHGDEMGTGSRHARHGGLGLIVTPGSGRVHHGIRRIAIIDQRMSGHRDTGAQRHA